MAAAISSSGRDFLEVMSRPSVVASLSSMFAYAQNGNVDDTASVYSSTSSTFHNWTPDTSFEVTAEQHRHLLGVQSSSASSTNSSMSASAKGKRMPSGRRLFFGNKGQTSRRRQQQQQQQQQGMTSRTSTLGPDNATTTTTAERDAVTVASQSGVRSVATQQTFSSHDTIKRSNKQQTYTTTSAAAAEATSNVTDNSRKCSTPAPTSSKKLSGWKQNLKKVATTWIPSRGRSYSEDHQPTTLASTSTAMMGFNSESRSRSYGTAATANTTTFMEEYEAEDELKQLDGVVDVLSLGSAFTRMMHPQRKRSMKTKLDAETSNDHWMVSCTGQDEVFDAAQTVQHMLRRSAYYSNKNNNHSNNDAVMIVLEGFYDQWSVRVEEQQTKQDSQSIGNKPQDNGVQRFPSYPPPPPPTSTTTSTTTITNSTLMSSPSPQQSQSLTQPHENDYPRSTCTKADGSPDMPTHKLWNTLWGSEPAPVSTLSTLQQTGANHSSYRDAQDDDAHVLDLVAQSSVPIDVDEDTFIVSTAEHVQAIQDIAAVPLAVGQFAAANRIFSKMVTGLEVSSSTTTSEPQVWHTLRAITYHNMGLLHLWQSQYTEAVKCFQQAVEARCSYTDTVSSSSCTDSSRVLRNNTAAMVVSLVRQGQAYFALHRYTAALTCFQQALEESALADQEFVRAKILVNMGVTQYCTGDLASSLASLTSALTIQRRWLEGPVRRESLVYDAAVTLQNMGKLYLEREDATDMARLAYEEALLLLKTVFPKHHPVVLSSYENVALCHVQSMTLEGKFEAIKLLEKCRRCRVEMQGTSATATIETCGWMAHLCATTGRLFQAETLYQAVYAWQKVWLPANHPAKLYVRKCLSRVTLQLRQQHHEQLQDQVLSPGEGEELVSPDKSEKNWI